MSQGRWMSRTCVASVLVLACQAGAAGPSVASSEPIGPLPSGLEPRGIGAVGFIYDTIRVSPDGMHIAYDVALGSRVGMVIDGKTSAKFDQIVPFIDGSRQMPSVETVRLVTTADQSHLAFLAQRGKGLIAVVDGAEVPLDADSVAPSEALFSEDGSSFAFIMTPQNGPGCVVLNGKPQEKYERVSQLKLSADGKHLAYVATVKIPPAEPGQGERYESFVVLDGKPGPKFDQDTVKQLVLSADGEHHAYVGRDPQAGLQLIVDGTPRESGNFAAFLQMSRDGKHVCCAIGKSVKAGPERYGITEMKWSVWFDGQSWPWATANEPQLTQLGKPVLNAAGDRVAYIRQDVTEGASGTVSQTVVVNGKDGQAYTAITNLRFAGDGEHVRYVAAQAQGGARKAFVVDGEDEAGPYEFKDFSSVGVVTSIDSADRKHTAYVGMVGQETVIAHDGKPVGRYENEVTRFFLSADGQHLGYFAPSPKTKQTALFVDGQLRAEVNGMLPMMMYDSYRFSGFSPRGGHVGTYSTCGVLVDGKPVTQVAQSLYPNFTTDDKHMMVQSPGNNRNGLMRGTSTLAVDGQPLAGFGIIGPATPMTDGTIKAFAVDLKKNEVVRITVTPGNATDFGVSAVKPEP